jgi:hypothetical protein
VLSKNYGVNVRDVSPAELKNNGGNDSDQFRHAGFVSGPHLYCPQCGTMHLNKKPTDMEMELCEPCKGQVTHKSKTGRF